MLRTVLLALICLAQSVAVEAATGHHRVRGYTKSDGTHVRSHSKTNPNHTQKNNWSSKPNTNPFTRKPGTKTPHH